MELWNVVPNDDVAYPFVLANPNSTLISFNKRVKFDINILMSSMEERDVPFNYTKGLKHVRFTILKDGGTYLNKEIMIHMQNECGSWWRESICQRFIHEVGHYVDEVEAICEDINVINEKKSVLYYPNTYSKKNIYEYIATGFEIYYFGSEEERRLQKKNNKQLYKRIKEAHNKYKSK
jgi:hypothetical protein